MIFFYKYFPPFSYSSFSNKFVKRTVYARTYNTERDGVLVTYIHTIHTNNKHGRLWVFDCRRHTQGLGFFNFFSRPIRRTSPSTVEPGNFRRHILVHAVFIHNTNAVFFFSLVPPVAFVGKMFLGGYIKTTPKNMILCRSFRREPVCRVPMPKTCCYTHSTETGVYFI